MARHRSSHEPQRWFLLASLLMSSTVFSQQSQQRGDASLTLEYQYVRTGDFDSNLGVLDLGKMDTHVILLSGDYALNERWTVYASLPYVQRRYTGVAPHDAVADFSNFVPPDLTFIDDGSYQKGFQDFYAGVRYLAMDGPLTVTPYISYGNPTNSYHIYGWSALGRDIWHLPVGATIGYTPYFSDWNFNADIAYVFTEETLGVDISHWLIYADARYYFTPRFSAKIFLTMKKSFNGLDFDQEFLSKYFDTETFYLHDRVLKHGYTNAGIGFGWFLSDRYELFGNMVPMVTPDQTNDIEYAVTIGLTRYFSGSN